VKTQPRVRRNPLAQMTEEELQQAVERIAYVFGWSKFHTRDSRGSEKGFPDLLMIRVKGDKKQLLVAELKKEGIEATPEQQVWLNLFAQVGAESFRWWPSDLPMIVKILR